MYPMQRSDHCSGDRHYICGLQLVCTVVLPSQIDGRRLYVYSAAVVSAHVLAISSHAWYNGWVSVHIGYHCLVGLAV